MATDEVRRRPKKKFTLLLSPITLPPPHHPQNQRGYMKYLLLLVLTALFLTYLYSPDMHVKATRNIHHKFDKPNMIQATISTIDDLDSNDDHNVELHHEEAPAASSSNNLSSSRPFQYIGDSNPAKPLPWPKSEADWWSLHQTLVERVKQSDGLTPKKKGDNDKSSSLLPQLVFYGDSITEGWNGTSFGNTPGPTRMWDNDLHCSKL